MWDSLRNSARVLAVVVGLVVVAVAADAQAQSAYYHHHHHSNPYNTPVFGSVDPWGNTRVVYQSRLNPEANVPMPGSTRVFFNGTTWVRSWIGMDGLPHSNVTTYNPATGTTNTQLRYAPSRR